MLVRLRPVHSDSPILLTRQAGRWALNGAERDERRVVRRHGEPERAGGGAVAGAGPDVADLVRGRAQVELRHRQRVRQRRRRVVDEQRRGTPAGLALGPELPSPGRAQQRQARRPGQLWAGPPTCARTERRGRWPAVV